MAWGSGWSRQAEGFIGPYLTLGISTQLQPLPAQIKNAASAWRASSFLLARSSMRPGGTAGITGPTGLDWELPASRSLRGTHLAPCLPAWLGSAVLKHLGFSCLQPSRALSSSPKAHTFPYPQEQPSVFALRTASSLSLYCLTFQGNPSVPFQQIGPLTCGQQYLLGLIGLHIDTSASCLP